METKKLKFPIAAVFYIIATVIDLILILLSGAGVFRIEIIIANIALIIPLFMKKYNPILLIGPGIRIVLVIVSIFRSRTVINTIGNLISFLAYLSLILIIAAMVIKRFESLQAIAQKIFFVPATLYIVSAVFDVVNLINLYGISSYGIPSIAIILDALLFDCIPLLLLAKWTLDPYEKEKTFNDTLANNTATGNAVLDYNESYCELVKHILLSLFTCGIWMMIWIHKTTKVLNKTPDAEQYDPTKKLLLCLFVPFYMVYWFKKHGERIDKLNAMQNNKSDNATMYLLLGLFIPVVACILMQDNINKLCAPATTTPQFVSAAPVSTEKTNVELLKEYKELLDMGAITQEEFDAKKQQLLNL